MTEVSSRAHAASQAEERAKAIWKAMRDEAVAKNLPSAVSEYGRGYYVTGTLIEYARACWPGTNFKRGSGKTAMNMIRQFLRSTGNVVPQANSRTCFVRAEWAYRDSIPVLVPIPTERQRAIADHEREAKRKEAKVTPEEAGETRQPAPVQYKQGEIMSHPQHGKGEADKQYPNLLNFSNGFSQCITCGHVFEKRTGISSHMRMHAEAQHAKEVAALQAENAALKVQVQQNVSALDPGTALTMVGEYIQIIKDECARLQEENESLRAQPAGNPEADAKIDLVREVLTRVQSGEVSMMRALSDINDALEA